MNEFNSNDWLNSNFDDQNRTRCSQQLWICGYKEQMVSTGRANFCCWISDIQRAHEVWLPNHKSTQGNRAHFTSPDVIERVWCLRRVYQLGPLAIVHYLARYYDIKTSNTDTFRIPKHYGVRALSHPGIKAFVSILSLLASLFVAATANDASAADQTPMVGHRDGISCRKLMGQIIVPHATVVMAEFNARGATIGKTAVNVPFCRIVGMATPSPDSRIGFEVWMPPSSVWNGKFQAEGSGASAGIISLSSMVLALKTGYATMSTDNGHITDFAQPNGANEQTWALGHPEKMLDFAYRALHLATVAAKDIVHRFYHRPPQESYFVGCSQGGHHALMEATRYPNDYNGIIAGAPAWHWVNQMVGATWNSMPAINDSTAITPESATLLNKAVIASCDKLDGVEDGVISDPRRCKFDLVNLQCTANADPRGCLTPIQVAAARHIYAGATKYDGVHIFQGAALGSELNWPRVWAGAFPGGSSWDFWRYSVFQDKSFNNAKFDFDKDTDRVFSTVVLGIPLTTIYNVQPNLERFSSRGGKLIIYHGWADPQITPYASIDFYRQVVAQMGQATTDSFLRLFMLPGIFHCQGGPGVGHLDDGTPTTKPDSQHDIVKALDTWVTGKKAPSVLIGVHLNQNNEVDRTRPLCRYPQEAKYKGLGDTNDAANFTCTAPSDINSD